jgi:hypothetical protein
MMVICLLLLVWAWLAEAAPPQADEVAALQQRVAAQQERLRAQHVQIDGLKKDLADTERLLEAWMARQASNPSAPASASAAPVPPPAPSAPPAGPERGIHIHTGQEIPTSPTPVSPSLKLGAADLRILGYVGLNEVYRSVALGGGPGTSFATVPFPNTPAGNISEFRLTTQTTRIALRVDVPLKEDRVAGYIETDFSGPSLGNALISSSSYGFRLRHAWVNYRHGKFELAFGQMYSLLTPSRSDIQPWPSDALITQVVDTNYVAGLVWDRSPGLRVVYRPDDHWAFALSAENPEQQVGPTVKFPAALASVLSTQYNTGSGVLRTPNSAPDGIFKVAWNTKCGARTFHVDSGTVLRYFRNFDPANVRQHKSAIGFGSNLNLYMSLTPKLRLITQGYWSSGGGRYIGGTLPDVIVRSDGNISPVKSSSWVGGFEWAPTRTLAPFAYYSGLYGARNTTIDLDGSQIGFGYKTSNAGRRLIEESTVGWSHTLWSSEDAGSVQYTSQYSYLLSQPWAPGNGPRFAHSHMLFWQIRYNLP